MQTISTIHTPVIEINNKVYPTQTFNVKSLDEFYNKYFDKDIFIYNTIEQPPFGFCIRAIVINKQTNK